VDRFSLRSLSKLEARKQYHIKISNWFAALGNLSDGKDINRAWENIKENIKTSAKESLGLQELKHRDPWCDEECLGFLDQRNHAKMRWLQDPQQSNLYNLKNVRREASKHFSNKKKEYLKAKIDELERK